MQKEKIIAIGFWLFSIPFFYILLMGFGFDKTEIMADTATTTATISNATPTVTALTPATPITLSENSTITATSTGTVQDNNGYGEITSVTAVFYNGATNSGCSSDENNCYTGINCATSSCADTTCSITCSATVYYYADATSSWVWYVTVSDDSSSSSTSSASVTVNTLTALDVSSSIAYGAIALGGTSDGVTTTITNTGNKDGLDAQVSASSAMTCDTGTLTQSTQHYATSTSGFTYGDGTALSDSPTAANISISQRTGATTTGSIYWKLQAPSSGVNGSCSGVNTFTAN